MDTTAFQSWETSLHPAQSKVGCVAVRPLPATAGPLEQPFRRVLFTEESAMADQKRN